MAHDVGIERMSPALWKLPRLRRESVIARALRNIITKRMRIREAAIRPVTVPFDSEQLVRATRASWNVA
jgi:hypothetical protein